MIVTGCIEITTLIETTHFNGRDGHDRGRKITTRLDHQCILLIQ